MLLQTFAKFVIHAIVICLTVECRAVICTTQFHPARWTSRHSANRQKRRFEMTLRMLRQGREICGRDWHFQFSTFNFPLSTFNFPFSTFHFQLSTFNFQLSTSIICISIKHYY